MFFCNQTCKISFDINVSLLNALTPLIAKAVNLSVEL